MTRRLARTIARQAARLLADVRPDHARALVTEVDHIPQPSEAITFALGGLWAAARIRLTAAVAGVTLSRAALAAAVGVVGAFHLIAPLGGLCAKLELLGGGPGACAAALSAPDLARVDETTLLAWVLRYLLIGGVGALYFYMAAGFAAGRSRGVYAAAAVAGALALASGFLGVTPPLPVSTYLVQLAGFCLAALALERVWRWDGMRYRARLAA